MLVACHRIHFGSALRFHTTAWYLATHYMHVPVPIDRADVRRFIESKHPRLPNRETTTHNKTTSHQQQVADRKRNLSATSKSLYHAARSPCAPYALTHNTCLTREQSTDRCPSLPHSTYTADVGFFRTPRQEKGNCSHNCLLCASPCLNALLSDRKEQKITVLGRAEK